MPRRRKVCAPEPAMRIGLISDTHGFLDPKVPDLFREVDFILHAGDVGEPRILLELEFISPVTAVLGNTDALVSLREVEICRLGGYTLLLHHIVNPEFPSRVVRDQLMKSRAATVIYGHTHRADDRIVDGIRFINPGYSGRPRFGQERSVAILHTGPGGLSLEFIPL